MFKLGCLVYNFSLIAGTVYLIQWHGWSTWSILLPVMFGVYLKK